MPITTAWEERTSPREDCSTLGAVLVYGLVMLQVAMMP